MEFNKFELSYIMGVLIGHSMQLSEKLKKAERAVSMGAGSKHEVAYRLEHLDITEKLVDKIRTELK